jgi:hypothetical protein
MYWGATDGARVAVDDPKRRTRRLTTIASVLFLGLGGTVAMASAATTHANAAPVAVHTAAAVVHGAAEPFDASFNGPKPPAVITTTTTVAKPHPAAAPAVHPNTTHPTTTHPTTTRPLSEQAALSSALKTRSTTPAAASLGSGSTCGAALAYLAANSAPGFHFECPGYALGHQAMTCVNVAGVCPGTDLIVIHTVCPASYMNEAHNSWIELGLRNGSIDPYGYCH